MITSVLSDYYKDTVVPQLKEKRGYKNPMEIPKLVKIVVNTGPLGKTPSFTDASPSVFLFYLPPTPPPTPSCNVTFFLSFPSQFLTLYQDWAGVSK